MARERDYMRPGTVVRHMKHADQWGIIRTVSSDGRYATVYWRNEFIRTHRLSDLIRAAAPCATCGERADAHKNADHAFTQEKTY